MLDPSHYVGYIPATLGDRVFADINPDGATPQEILGGNGVQDVGEHGIDGIIVQLYTDDHVLVAQTVTRDGGFYEFTDLPPGDYELRVGLYSPQDWARVGVGDGDFVVIGKITQE